jgi:TatD DNase family protein
MDWIDTHAHLYAEEFSEDADHVLERCRSLGIKKIYLPNIDSSSILPLRLLVKKAPDLCFPMMGLHPTSVRENYEEEIELIRKELFSRPDDYVAIGETGTDHYWDKTFEKEMDLAFEQQISWASELNKPIIIHSRSSLDRNIEIIKKYQDKNLRLRGIFHCFNGTSGQARQITSLGFHLGIGGIITFKNAGMDKVLKEVDLSSLVLETDAPYLAPVPYRGKRNSSEYIPLIAEKLAEIKGLSLSEVSKITTENARNLFTI